MDYSVDTKPRQIAVVDDDQSVRKSVARLLRAAGMSADTFSSGVMFLNALRTRSFDCVVLDLHMPELGGLEVIAQLPPSCRHLPAIIVTGLEILYSRERAFASGAAGYLLKPRR